GLPPILRPKTSASPGEKAILKACGIPRPGRAEWLRATGIVRLRAGSRSRNRLSRAVEAPVAQPRPRAARPPPPRLRAPDRAAPPPGARRAGPHRAVAVDQ